MPSDSRKQCTETRGRRLQYQREYMRKRREENPEKHRAYRRYRYSISAKLRESTRRAHFKKYGISIDVYDRLVEAQHGLCAICGKSETKRSRTGAIRRLAVDHDHNTGVIRGLLCSMCNIGLGNFRDNPELLFRAVDYLTGRTQ